MPYSQPRTPRVYVNYNDFFIKKGITTGASIALYSSENSDSIHYTNQSTVNFNSLSNNSATGLFGLTPHNYYNFSPRLDQSSSNFYGTYNTLFGMTEYLGLGQSSLIGKLVQNWVDTKDSNDESTGYIAILGHNLHELDLTFEPLYRYKTHDNTSEEQASLYWQPILNCQGYGTVDPDSNGYSILEPTCDGVMIARLVGIQKKSDYSDWWTNPIKFHIRNKSETALDANENYNNIQLGSIAFGQYFDFKHSANLETSITKSYEGIKSIQTMSGSTISNINFAGNPTWGQMPSWSSFIADNDYKVWNIERRLKSAIDGQRSGRRMYNLGFSFLGNEDVMAENELYYLTGTAEAVSNQDAYESTDLSEDISSNNQFISDLYRNNDDLYSRFINPTLNGSIPFIFQPDKLDFNSHNFSICTLDQKSYSIDQTAPNLYNTKMKFVETW